MSYQPIENYGIIGNMYTVAHVGMHGSIDWFCFPNHDSPSVFAAILDDKKGGRFSIAPTTKEASRKQLYWPDTNVLVTRFLSSGGVGEIIDFMPAGIPSDDPRRHWLVRGVRVLRGRMQFQMNCTPAFNYARDAHQTKITGDGAAFHSENLSLGLTSSIPLKIAGKGAAVEFTLEEGALTSFVLRQIPPGADCGNAVREAELYDLFHHTIAFWRNWLSRCTYKGRWREHIQRSALALKLLTYEPTGAIVAAGTCSLPEGVGGERNWDYRYTWIRDAAFTVYGLMRIGFTDEAKQFMGWITNRCKEIGDDGSLQIMYGIDGRHTLTEETLDHLDGYRGSRPVRIGNGAYSQRQLDIYGELMDAVYLYNKYGSPISYDLWEYLRRLINWVCDNWNQKDDGVWEVRGGQQHFVYSKLMCWVALDRGLRLADKRSFPAEREKWLKVRDEIYEAIMKQGWSPKRKAFVQYFGSDALDASNLMMPLVFFVSPTDERMLQTLDATILPPEKGGLVANSLVYRYNALQTADGLTGQEGTFNICTFWLVEALTRAGRDDPARLNEARVMFEQMLSYANHLGLFAEEAGPCSEALGNFPQAFTHLALISAAFNLDRTLG